MQRTAFSIPSWAPAVAATGLIVWAVSIWWMVASLPTGGDTSTVETGISVVATELEAAHRQIEALTAEVEALRTGGEELASRVDALESHPTVDAAFEMSTTAEDGADASGEADEAAGAEGHPLFTDGADRYNCRNFTSYEEAQEALRMNRPGDPNRIDMNDNEIACEDFRYPAPPAIATP